mmetsp:Transcript_70866/g.153911  ORF Transcript_70866/g.153911 Transcript_70866/m.153911 type:complete len:205 (-) Transcript_70866:1415-2029(-)
MRSHRPAARRWRRWRLHFLGCLRGSCWRLRDDAASRGPHKPTGRANSSHPRSSLARGRCFACRIVATRARSLLGQGPLLGGAASHAGSGVTLCARCGTARRPVGGAAAAALSAANAPAAAAALGRGPAGRGRTANEPSILRAGDSPRLSARAACVRTHRRDAAATTATVAARTLAATARCSNLPTGKAPRRRPRRRGPRSRSRP